MTANMYRPADRLLLWPKGLNHSAFTDFSYIWWFFFSLPLFTCTTPPQNADTIYSPCCYQLQNYRRFVQCECFLCPLCPSASSFTLVLLLLRRCVRPHSPAGNANREKITNMRTFKWISNTMCFSQRCTDGQKGKITGNKCVKAHVVCQKWISKQKTIAINVSRPQTHTQKVHMNGRNCGQKWNANKIFRKTGEYCTPNPLKIGKVLRS